MAGKDGRESPTLEERLLSEGHRYSLVQAYRLLRLLLPEGSLGAPGGSEERLFARPHLSPDSRGAEVISIVKEKGSEQEGYTISARFPGLFETPFPLPPLYAEDLGEEASAGGTTVRDSLECLARPLYRLLFESWAKYHLSYGIIEKGDMEDQERLLCLISVSVASLKARFPNPLSLLFCLGSATQMPRSAEGLRAFLAGLLHEPTLKVEECVPEKIAIPGDLLFSLGVRNHSLGETALCGSRIEDQTGLFHVRVGPVSGARFQSFLPDKPLFQALREGIRFYMDQPFDWRLQIAIEPSEIGPACLGNARESRLGWNTWLSSERPHQENTVTFAP